MTNRIQTFLVVISFSKSNKSPEECNFSVMSTICFDVSPSPYGDGADIILLRNYSSVITL